MAKTPRRQTRKDVDRMLRGPMKKKAKSPRAASTRQKHKGPRAAALPGMEDVRIRGLDDVCASISENRGAMNELRATDGDLLNKALKLMRMHERTSWRHAGVELLRVPGEEKIRVRTSKEQATAETAETVEVQDTEAIAGDGAHEGDGNG
jgi:hypothetical protein